MLPRRIANSNGFTKTFSGQNRGADLNSGYSIHLDIHFQPNSVLEVYLSAA